MVAALTTLLGPYQPKLISIVNVQMVQTLATSPRRLLVEGLPSQSVIVEILVNGGSQNIAAIIQAVLEMAVVDGQLLVSYKRITARTCRGLPLHWELHNPYRFA